MNPTLLLLLPLLLASACSDAAANDSDSQPVVADTGDTGDSPGPSAFGLSDADASADCYGGVNATGETFFYSGGAIRIPVSGIDGELVVIDGARDPAAVGDVDGDGNEDLLLRVNAGEADDSLAVVSTTGSELYRIAYDDAGRPDVWGAGPNAMALGTTAGVTVYNPGDFGFAAPINTVVYDDWLNGIREADFTGDGVDDHLVVAPNYPDGDYGLGKVWILDGSDRGVTVGEADAFASLTANDASGRLTATPVPEDVDGDGQLDLVVEYSGLSIYAVGAGGVIDPLSAARNYSNIYDGRIADFDGDGTPDLVGTVRNAPGDAKAPGFGVLFGTPGGYVDFADALSWRMDEGTQGELVTHDIDADGVSDVIFQGGSGGGVRARTYLFLGGPERAME